MARKIIFLKLPIYEAVKQGIVNVAVPMTSKDIDIYNKLGSPFRASITKSRNLMHHRKFFACMGVFVDNGILDKFPMESSVLESLRNRFKDDVYTLVYILKYLYLPLEVEILPNGKQIERVSSISFDEMDQDKFTEFYNKCLDYCCSVIEISREQLEMNTE